MNWLNNTFFPNQKASRLHIREFQPVLDGDSIRRINLGSSPSRALSDLFWMQLPWEKIRTELGPIHALDTGCGSGRYGEQLQVFSGGRIESYTGLDETAHPDWPDRMKQNEFVHLIQADSAFFSQFIPSATNFFISQSAIEHFPQDLIYFRQVRDFIHRKVGPVLQIHLFPSAACLPLYRFHGVRQYTPRTISLISNLFPDASCVLFQLGGAACNKLHFEYITRPVLLEGQSDRRATEAGEYSRHLLGAMASAPSEPGDPSFYALVIQSRLTKAVF